MYAERITRLEEEISHALQPPGLLPHGRAEVPAKDDTRALSEPALYPVQTTRAPRT
jgi:hypothetical protein